MATDTAKGSLNPVVSIIMVAYNHGQFISEAIEGCLMQKTTFPTELLIADDASSDDTQAIISQFADNYPGFIRPILRSKNIGANPNWFDAFSKCKGRYIAICEGDDYWTATDKLQREVDFLEQNPSYSLVCTDYGVLDQSTGRATENYLRGKYHLTVEKDVHLRAYMFRRYTIRSLTTLMRGDAVREYLRDTDPRITNNTAAGDLPLWLYMMSSSKVRFLPISMAMYRVRPGTGSRPDGILQRKQFRDGISDILEYYIDKNDLSGIYRRKLKFQKTLDAMEFYRDTGDRSRMWKSFFSMHLRGFTSRRALAIISAKSMKKQKWEIL